MTASGLVLAVNGTELTVAANESTFAFPAGVAIGASYAVTVATQPTGQTCTVGNGTGTVGTTDITSVSVTCAVTGYSLGGSISGLTSSGLVLANGSDKLNVAAHASTFTMPTAVAGGAEFNITVTTQPSGLTCTVTGGTGTMGSANMSNAVVTCSATGYSLGGTVSGLNGSGLVLGNGGNTVTVPVNATSFTFPAAVATGASYAVTINTQPLGLACAITHNSGIMPASAVTSVSVTCTDQPFSLGGSVSGLITNGLELANGSVTVTVPANATSFTFSTPVPYGSRYAVTVATQPTGLTCTVSNGAGAIPAGDVTNVTLVCADNAYSLGGSISGLTAAGLVLSNGSSMLTVANGATTFTLPTAVAYGASYTVTVSTQPTGLICNLSNGAGTMPAAAVSNVAVVCASRTYTVGGSISGASTPGLVLANGSDSLTVLANATVFTMPTAAASGTSYNLVVSRHPGGQACNVSNGSGTIGSSAVTNIAVTCTAGTASLFYAFGTNGSNDGHNPYGGLTLGTDGNFYGLTSYGGANTYGTAFKITPAGVESIVWSFGSGNDGRQPPGNMILGSDGNFYGVTAAGGTTVASQGGYGTVFKITPAGVESVVHNFTSGNDGQYPYAGLIQASDGNLYGITLEGGANSAGVVFKITLPAGTESVIHAFGSSGDAENPEGNLVQGSDGNLYGLTQNGGANSMGAVFKISLAGVESVLHSFGSGSDGASPEGNLIQASDGDFYGMTSAGGAHSAGTVFKISLAGVESVLHSFGSGSDGASPYGSLIQGSDGNFYGMTDAGGTSNLGTVIMITAAGAESVLYSFMNNGIDGSHPYYGSLSQASNGDLFGLTGYGGAYGFGTVFTIN